MNKGFGQSDAGRLYYERLFNARQLDIRRFLDLDIKNVLGCVPPGTPIHHHIEQFSRFCATVYDGLKGAFSKYYSPASSAEHKVDHEVLLSQALECLGVQWSVLRAAALQRMDSSPYRAGLERLDEEIHWRYQHLVGALKAINPQLTEGLSRSYPLAYVSDRASVRLFGNAPPVISVPFSALYEDEKRDGLPAPRPYAGGVKGEAGDTGEDEPTLRNDRAIACIGHELGHVLVNNISGLLADLEGQVARGLVGRIRNTHDRQEKLLVETVLVWLEEIVVDLIGAALMGPDTIRAMINLGRVPDNVQPTSIRKHPPAIIRPRLQLYLLEQLRSRKGDDARSTAARSSRDEWYNDQLAQLTKDLEITSSLLDERFSIPAVVTVVQQKEVLAWCREMVDAILAAKPAALRRRRSVADILFRITEPPVRTTGKSIGLPKWGEEIDPKDCENLVLEIGQRDQDPITAFLTAIGILSD